MSRTKGPVLVAVVLAASIAVGAWMVLRYRENERLRPLVAGISALKGGEYAAALEHLRPLAEAGDRVAQHELAYIYAAGLGVQVDDIEAAMWLRREECGSVASGSGEFAFAMGFATGRGGSKADASRALTWLRRAAEAGHVEAQRLLADRTRLASEGFHVDDALVKYWSKREAERTIRR